MLKLVLFGSGQAYYDDQPITDFPHTRAGKLFCYLLLNRHHPHQRDHLAGAFWGDRSTAAARKCLRNAIWRLRRMLDAAGADADEYLLVTNDCVSFIRTSNFWLDAAAFATAVYRFRDISGESLIAEQAAELETAVDLYIGDLLEGVYSDWVLYEREEMRLAYLGALNKLLVFHSTRGSIDCGLEYGKRLLALDNTHEKTHRQMMWLHNAAGNYPAALAQFEQCRDVLQAELGIHPMAETCRLYKQIKQRRLLEPGVYPADRLAAPRISSEGGAAHPLLAHALRRLQHLQETIEQSRAEARQIGYLLHDILSTANESS